MVFTFKLSAGAFNIELSGTQEYVESIIVDYKLKEAVETLLSKAISSNLGEGPVIDLSKSQVEIPPSGKELQIVTSKPSSPDVQSDISNVCFVGEDGMIKILVPIPGATKKAKQLNFIYLYSYLKLQQKIEEVGFKELKSASEFHGVLDANNFATILGNEPTLIVKKDGANGPNSTLRLTMPAIKHAKTLLSELSQQAF